MSTKDVVVGAGPVGTELTALLAASDRQVTVVTRGGRSRAGAGTDSVTHVAADASDPERLSEVASGARAIFNCANPTDYTQWERVWPPLAESLLTAAERTGATLVITGTLYPYGPGEGPMVEGQPDRATDHKGRLRARMWADALERHRAGRLNAVEVRGSDYLGPRVGPNGHISRHLPAARRGRSAQVIGSPDLPHTWTDVGDMARTLASVADREVTWGRVWHAPSNEPKTQRQALEEVLAAGGLAPVQVRGTADWMLAVAGLVSPLVRELRETSYMFRQPYVMSSSRTTEFLGLAPTPWDEVCRRTVSGN
jgi:nucleoside-diphosphate-sugar epimerase